MLPTVVSTRSCGSASPCSRAIASAVSQFSASSVTTYRLPMRAIEPWIIALRPWRWHTSRATGSRQRLVRPPAHQLQRLAHAIVGDDVEKRRLAELHRQRLPQRAVEHRRRPSCSATSPSTIESRSLSGRRRRCQEYQRDAGNSDHEPRTDAASQARGVPGHAAVAVRLSDAAESGRTGERRAGAQDGQHRARPLGVEAALQAPQVGDEIRRILIPQLAVLLDRLVDDAHELVAARQG